MALYRLGCAGSFGYRICSVQFGRAPLLALALSVRWYHHFLFRIGHGITRIAVFGMPLLGSLMDLSLLAWFGLDSAPLGSALVFARLGIRLIAFVNCSTWLSWACFGFVLTFPAFLGAGLHPLGSFIRLFRFFVAPFYMTPVDVNHLALLVPSIQFLVFFGWTRRLARRWHTSLDFGSHI